MLFYFKSREQWSEPAGVILVEGCTIKLEPATMNDGSYGFALGTKLKSICCLSNDSLGLSLSF
jgi:hypothetical protein